jgi:hypothetical protein
MPQRQITVSTLPAKHLAELRELHANPRLFMFPQRRDLYKRLGLIRPDEPPRAPRIEAVRLRAPAPRRHVLTELGLRVIAEREAA